MRLPGIVAFVLPRLSGISRAPLSNLVLLFAGLATGVTTSAGTTRLDWSSAG